MKKYVLNIEKLYSGQTANALVLNQVDEDFPILIPPLESIGNLGEFKERWQKVYKDFQPAYGLTLDEVNDYIIGFNLDLQTKFKRKGRQELYMMDDTTQMKPNESNASIDKTYLHCINGKEEKTEANSSQMNVIFPYKKLTSKSIYSSQLKVQSDLEIDDTLERARGITLQGKVSYEKCLQGVAQVGNNLYIMSPSIDVEEKSPHIHGNGITIVNSYSEQPYYFPHSMTLFQPSQDKYDFPNLAAEEPMNFTEFIEWYETHSRKTVVTLDDTYGKNVSMLNCMGVGSYEIAMGTYCPTGIVLSDGWRETSIPLNSDTYRQVRNGESYGNQYKDKKYIFDNGVYDDKERNTIAKVGFMFNMYDTYINGNDRILKMHIPVDKDFNKLRLNFGWEVRKDSFLLGDFDATVYVNEDLVFEVNGPASGEYSRDIDDTAVKAHDITITVRIHYSVDFGRRNTEREYRDMLKNSGVILNDIRIENGVSDGLKYLTFGSYVNESGITEDEHDRRYDQFWLVSQYKKDMAYQTVIESSLKNTSSSGILYRNNYSSGDIYGDMFVTKSVLDPNYNMDMNDDHLWDNAANEWTSGEDGTKMLQAIGRDYLDIGQCSNQLFLVYRPTDLAIGYLKKWRDADDDGVYEPDERVFARRTNRAKEAS